MASGHSGAAAFKMYIGVFVFLTVLTVVEMAPLLGLWDNPAPILLAMSAVKFVAVCLFFMHLLGDAPIYTRLFFIPLVMVIVTLLVLMTLFNSFNLNYRVGPNGEDSEEVAARYRGVWAGECNAWAKSPFTGNEYCASGPADARSASAILVDTQKAYDDLKKPAAADPRFEGFAAKTADEQKAVLMAVGEETYKAQCMACHQASGVGVPGAFPPLAGDPVANAADHSEHVTIVLKGLMGKAINGVSYAAAMPAFPQLTNEQIAAVVTYERGSWGNAGSVVAPEQVASLR
jgi:mono/diheme cytochrome c family protein